MKGVGVALFAAGIALGNNIAPAVGGPCSEELADLDRRLELNVAKRSKPRLTNQQSAKPAPAPRALPEQRYDAPLALARKLDAEGNEDCHKAVAEVEMLIGQ
jgi:hypothetical protein